MIPLLPLRLEFSPRDALRLPRYPGSAWRGAFGHQLRELACMTGAPTCKGCHLIRHCAYGQTFETPPPQNLDSFHGRYPEVPHPYVLSPRHGGGAYAAGQTLAVDLILLPDGVRNVQALMGAMARLQLQGVALSLDRIRLLPPVGAGAGEAADLAGVMQAQPCAPEPPPVPAAVGIHFEHPLRLRRNNRYVGPGEFAFATFFTTLARRLSMLSATLGRPLEADYRGLAAAAADVAVVASDLQWFDWSRHSGPQQRRVPMGGLIGNVHLRGNLAPLWPWLWTGQWLHAGKGAVMGLGRYRLAVPPAD